MSENLNKTLRDALATRGLLVESIDPDLITQTIDRLTSIQRLMIRFRFGLTGLRPKSLEEFCELVGDKNPASAEKIWKDGMNSLTHKISEAIRNSQRLPPEPDPEDGKIRLNGKLATEKQVNLLNTKYVDSTILQVGEKALARSGIVFIGDLIQLSKDEFKTRLKIRYAVYVCIRDDLISEDLSFGTRVTGWKRPEILE